MLNPSFFSIAFIVPGAISFDPWRGNVVNLPLE
jgi:hypothetical protein